MAKLLEIRTAIFNLYEKADYIIKPIMRFMLYLVSFLYIRSLLGYNESFQRLYIVILLSIVAAFVPRTIAIALILFYMILLLYPVSIMMAGAVVVFTCIFICFFYRQIVDYNYVIIGMPILMTIKMPFLLPICLGLFGNPITIIPTCIGVFMYYFIGGINRNVSIIEKIDSADSPFALFISVLDSLVKDNAMLITMIVLTVVIVTVYIIKNLKIDYSFLVASLLGSMVSMIGFLLASLKCDMGMNMLSIIVFSMLSALIAGLLVYLYRPLSYNFVENVTFEDDDYYYYVRAIPKIKLANTKVSLKNFSLEDVKNDLQEEAQEELEK